MPGFKDVLESIPACGPLWRSDSYLDPTSGIVVTELTSPNVLEAKQYRSVIVAHTPQGPLQVVLAIKANTLLEAQLGWQAAARQALVEFDLQVQQNAKRIIVPSPPMPHGRPHA